MSYTATTCVIGEGAWGTAWAQLLAARGTSTVIWCHDTQVALELNQQGTNSRYLPAITLPYRIQATTDSSCCTTTTDIYCTTPTCYLRETLYILKPYIHPETRIWCLQKAVEQGTGLLPYEVVQDVMPHASVGCLYGPGFARDIIAGSTCTITCAVRVPTAYHIAQSHTAPSCTLEYTSDLCGTSWCAITKNIIALGIGILRGRGYSASCQVQYLYRCMQELTTHMSYLGGNNNTPYLSCGYPDSVLSSFSHGRNVQTGMAIGQGMTPPHQTAEGLYSAHAWDAVLTRFPEVSFRMPLIDATCRAAALHECQILEAVLFKHI